MKRATRHPVRTLLLELHVVLNDPDDFCLSFEIVDECLGVTHLSVKEKSCGSNNAEGVRHLGLNAEGVR
jgi:hypothetical protein